MKATDLRVGNQINDMFGDMVTVMGITDKGIWIRSYSGPGYEDAFSGIPLTPEILESMGAVNRYGVTYFIGKLKFTYEHNEISQFVRFHYSGKVTYLQYVHELQNLAQILTNTQLTLT